MRQVREAKLREGYCELYPRVPQETWIPARELLRLVAREQQWDGRTRLSRHFEFAGGHPRGPTWSGIVTRGSDPWIYESD